jgi:methylated-DNA-[protein]-cysteine S-methyltransferase
MKYDVFSTGPGWVACAVSPLGLAAVTIAHPTRREALDAIGAEDTDPESDITVAEITGQLAAYFQGGRPLFDFTLDYGKATAFQRAVWEATRSIPYGETRSYGWVARSISKPAAVRAVGQALGRNPLAIVVPCHRVIGSDGDLTGFGGGVDLKRRLLALEGVRV